MNPCHYLSMFCGDKSIDGYLRTSGGYIMKKKAFLLGLTCVFALAVVMATGCGRSSNSSSNDNSTTQNASASSNSTQSQYAVTIDKCTAATTYDGKAAIYVDYTFTNNSQKATEPIAAVSCQAFQNGVQLDTAILTNTTGYDAANGMKEIKSGASLTFQEAYVLDDTSTVSIEVSNLFSFGDKTIVTQDFNVA